MAYGKSSTWDPVREVAFGAISEAYVAIGVATNKAVRIIKFTNATNQVIYVSKDGTTDHLKMPANSYAVWDVTANKAIENRPQFIEIGTIFYARGILGSDPTAGWVSVETLIVERGS